MNRLAALAVITLTRWSLSGLLVFAAIGTSYLPATAQDLNPKEGDFFIKNFHFRSGEVLPELRIHWATLGTPKRDLSGRITNAVLLLHGTGVSGGIFLGPNFTGGNIATQLFGEGQPLDAGQYYLIIPDAIGHGRSSKAEASAPGKDVGWVQVLKTQDGAFEDAWFARPCASGIFDSMTRRLR